MVKEIIKKNQSFLNGTPRIYFSPGRVNLIGEHIDYLGGNVFPSAITLGTYAFVTKRDDDKLVFLSENFAKYGTKTVRLSDLEYKEKHNWINYPKGMFKKYIDKGHKINHGLNILIYGTLPNSSGLSSSASLELLTAHIIKHEYNLPIDNLEAVIDAKDVENNYVGVNCGIMDQFAIGMAIDHHAIYLNTSTLEYEQVPFELGDYTLIIANTRKKRSLADSKYNERVSECKQGLNDLQQELLIKEICELDETSFEKHKTLIQNPTVVKRVEHAVYENSRTKKAVYALKNKNLILLGKLMNQSHDSLRDLYEVSCEELDTLVNSFRKHGAIGSRMTGAGFGGCAIALVQKKQASQIIKQVGEEYQDAIHYKAGFYIVRPSHGPKEITKDVK